MSRRGSGRLSAPVLRQQLAQEAARLMSDHGIADFGLAKRKAAERFGVRHAGALPSNAQIEACLAEHQRLFDSTELEERLRELRAVALRVMQALADCSPRLVGPVLTGTATVNTIPEVHVFSESIEAVADMLAGQGLTARHCEKRYRFGGGRIATYPGFRVAVDGAVVIVQVFPENGLREAPLSSVDQRPMQRASTSRVMELLQQVGMEA